MPPVLESFSLLVPLACVCGLLLLLLLVALRISGRLARIEQRMADRDAAGEAVPDLQVVGTRRSHSRSRVFEQFLSEDPSRRRLAKKEQFAAYRRWRREKGLNWGS